MNARTHFLIGVCCVRYDVWLDFNAHSRGVRHSNRLACGHIERAEPSTFIFIALFISFDEIFSQFIYSQPKRWPPLPRSLYLKKKLKRKWFSRNDTEKAPIRFAVLSFVNCTRIQRTAIGSQMERKKKSNKSVDHRRTNERTQWQWPESRVPANALNYVVQPHQIWLNLVKANLFTCYT